MNETVHGSRSLAAVAWSFIILGSLGVAAMVYAFLTGNVSVELGVLLIPLGVGLLRRSPLARTLAIVIAWFTAVAALVFAVVLWFVHGSLEMQVCTVKVGQVSKLVACLVLLAYFVLALWQQSVLLQPSVRRQFEPTVGPGVEK